REIKNTPRMMLENQRVLKVEMGVLLVVVSRQGVMVSLEAMANLRQMAGVLQKAEGLSGSSFAIISF
ncbi:MAG: hypothetical protein ACI9PD_001194, partial [Psychrobacter glaciei]